MEYLTLFGYYNFFLSLNLKIILFVNCNYLLTINILDSDDESESSNSWDNISDDGKMMEDEIENEEEEMDVAPSNNFTCPLSIDVSSLNPHRFDALGVVAAVPRVLNRFARGTDGVFDPFSFCTYSLIYCTFSFTFSFVL